VRKNPNARNEILSQTEMGRGKKLQKGARLVEFERLMGGENSLAALGGRIVMVYHINDIAKKRLTYHKSWSPNVKTSWENVAAGPYDKRGNEAYWHKEKNSLTLGAKREGGEGKGTANGSQKPSGCSRVEEEKNSSQYTPFNRGRL